MAEKPRKYSRRGPVPRDAEERRTHAITVRFNDKERAELEKRCQAAGGMTQGKFLRLAALDCIPPAPVPSINCEALELLGEIGRELKAYKREDFQGQIPSEHADALVALEGLLLNVSRLLLGLPIAEAVL